MGQKAGHREQIYRQNAGETWARRLACSRGNADADEVAEEGQQRKCSRGDEADEVQQR